MQWTEKHGYYEARFSRFFPKQRSNPGCPIKLAKKNLKPFRTFVAGVPPRPSGNRSVPRPEPFQLPERPGACVRLDGASSLPASSAACTAPAAEADVSPQRLSLPGQRPRLHGGPRLRAPARASSGEARRRAGSRLRGPHDAVGGPRQTRPQSCTRRGQKQKKWRVW